MMRAAFICFLMCTFSACQPEQEFNDPKYQLVYDTYTESTFQYVEIPDGSEILESPVIEFVEVDDDRDYGFSIIKEFENHIYTVSFRGKSVRVYPIDENGNINPTLSSRFSADGNGPGEYNEIFGLAFIDSTLFLHDGPKFKVNSYDPSFNHINDYLIQDIKPSLGGFTSIDNYLIYTQTGVEDFKLKRYDTKTETSSPFFEKLIKSNLQPRSYNSTILYDNGDELVVSSRYLPILYFYSLESIDNNHPDHFIRLGTLKLEMIGKETKFNLGNIGGKIISNPPLKPIDREDESIVNLTPAIQSIAINDSWIFLIATEGIELIALRRSNENTVAHFETFNFDTKDIYPYIHIVRNKLYLTNNSNTIAIIDLDRLYDTYK